MKDLRVYNNYYHVSKQLEHVPYSSEFLPVKNFVKWSGHLFKEIFAPLAWRNDKSFKEMNQKLRF